jgi:hypothetical protein
MVDQVFQIQYRDEFIASFEQHQSLLRDTVTTEAVIKGNQAIFLVAGSGGAEASTRGSNGLITARSDDQSQNTATLSEWHDLVRKTDFNVFASQGNQRAIMQMTTMAVINRKIDQDIIAACNSTTVTTGSSSDIPSVTLFQRARVLLSNAEVPWDSNITLLCQPAFLAYLELAPEFSSAEYVTMRPFAGEGAEWRDQPGAYRWKSTLIIEHPNLPGQGTTSGKSWLYHKNSVGHAANTAGMDSSVGYNDEQKYSYARCSLDMGSVLLQAAGCVEITADGTALES